MTTTIETDDPCTDASSSRQASRAFAFRKLFSLARCATSGGGSPPNKQSLSSSKPSPLLEEVDHVLASTGSDAEARDVLRGMVGDLLRENDALRQELAQKDTQMQKLTTETADFQEQYRGELALLQQAVETKCGANVNLTKKPEDKAVLAPSTAANMVVQGLSQKIESLNLQVAKLQGDLASTREKMEDLESLNEARLYTIDALENRFVKQNRPDEEFFFQRQKESSRNSFSLLLSSPHKEGRNRKKPVSPIHIRTPDSACSTAPSSTRTDAELDDFPPFAAFDDTVDVGPMMGEI